MGCFNPRPLCRERQAFTYLFYGGYYVSIHAPYAGSDDGGIEISRHKKVSIHAPYAGSDHAAELNQGFDAVSIHAPYAGSDTATGTTKATVSGFNPRPLCRERPKRKLRKKKRKRFQSTPPMQGATLTDRNRWQMRQCFNPRPLCRERLDCFAGGGGASVGFNPRPLCRERHFERRSYDFDALVSIHAPYAGSDPGSEVIKSIAPLFQSTPPMQGATILFDSSSLIDNVSIHAPYAGSDSDSCRGLPVHRLVSIHAPYAGSDLYNYSMEFLTDVSIHAPYAGSDQRSADLARLQVPVSIHAPYAGSDTSEEAGDDGG